MLTGFGKSNGTADGSQMETGAFGHAFLLSVFLLVASN